MQPADTAPHWDLLARHLTGETSPAEEAALRAWLTADPANVGLLTEATRTWARVGSAPAAVAEPFALVDVDSAWQRFADKHLPPTTAPADARPPAGKVVRMRPRGISWSAAAAVAGVALVGGWLLGKRVDKAVIALADTVITTTDTPRRVTLPDGSRAWLNQNSSLRYAASLGGQTRRVTLKGEGFFEVRQLSGRAFVVLTPQTRVRVLGTAFNVRAYPGEDSVEVSVRTGRVALAARLPGADSVVLTPGQRGVWRQPTLHRDSAATSAAAGNAGAWQRRELVFDNARLDYVARVVATTCGVRVHVAGRALRRCRFTGRFQQPEAADVLRVVSVATGATLTQLSDGSWQLVGGGCH